MPPVVRGPFVSVSRTSIQLPYRRISNRNFPRPSRAFHQTPRARASDGDNNKSDGAATRGDAQNDSESLRAEDADPPKDTCTALSLPPVKDLAHYGSAARRSKRSKSHQEVTSSVRIPEWFIANNVRPLEDLGTSQVTPLRWDSEKAEYVDPGKGPQSKPGEASGMEPLGEDETQETPEGTDSPTSTPYYVDLLQWEELVSTTRGLLKLTAPFIADDVASKKNNLVLHYAGEGGDYLLDELVQRLALEVRADTVVLDALDIADLACEPHNNSMFEDVANDRRLLSYDVYQKEDGHTNEQRREEEQVGELEEYDEEEEGRPDSTRPIGTTVFLDLRGSPLDLTPTGLPRGRRRLGQMDSPERMISHLGSSLSDKISEQMKRAKAAQERLVPLVEAVLAGPYLKRTMRQHEPSNGKSSEATSTVSAQQVELPLVLEIRDLKLVQQTALGRRFLMVLYDHVQRRRRRGQRVMIIGTETFAKADQYSADNIRSLQSEPPGSISRTMVVTPAVPSTDARIMLWKDKKRRTKTINMRHLWQMLCIKVPGLYDNNDLRQDWTSLTGDFAGETWCALDFLRADRQLWTFDQVHRLATMIVGRMESNASASISDCLNQACMNLQGSDNARFAWTEQQRSHRTKSKPDIERTENQRLDKIRKKLTRYEKKLIGGVIEHHKIATTFDHVHAPLDTIDALKTLTTLSLVRPDAFKYGVLASDKIPGLLLYGPPGTGKTLLAKAVAKESGATVLEVSGAELNDMYVGEGEKNVKALFSLAKKLTPCVVFIDEADAVFSARGGGQRRVSHRELLNQFLREWDGMSNDAGSAFILVATNRPFDLDDAVLRRLPRRLLVDLPTENDRLEILKIHLKDEILAEDVSLAKLAARTPFYSGSDLKNLSVAAALNCVREENEQAKNHSGEDAFAHAETRSLTAAHFERALDDISSSISEDMSSLKEIKKFDEQFGDKRGKKKKSPKWGFNTTAEADKALDTVKVRS
jgi:SpoVK/Ycf46/Vps4 family AAA+-type ATPase